jgi:hypothetical protein
MSWCKVTITYAGTGYSQKYKRRLAVHSDPLSQQFNRDAKHDAVTRINASLPRGHQPNPVTENLLGMVDQGDQMQKDPGKNYRAI